MNLLNAEQLSKSYGMKKLFHGISLGIETSERIGLIGINGTGKSTLLQVLAGDEKPDQGKISYANGITIEYLSQNPPFDPSDTVIEHIFKGKASTLLELHEYEAKRILTKLGIDRFDDLMGSLSGGQRKRVQLAAVLIRPSDLLILDEPTNHLDTDAVAWLEQHLKKSNAALLMITHDRYFLNRVANRMMELDQGELFHYTGNYSVFLEKKAERLEIQHAAERKRQNLLRNELAWMRRGAQARSTKQKARIDRFHELEKAESRSSGTDLEISLLNSRLGKKVIELRHISKSYADRVIISNFNYLVQRDDRIGIIGPNGRGKSTLLDLISGRLQPDQGEVITGPTVSIGYFTQEAQELDDSIRLIDYIRQGAEQIASADGTLLSASKMLERFLFPPSAQYSLIGSLSGGEKRRLYLLRILMEAPNVLLLDEPTNDLDIQTLTILESYLDDFPGAVVAVSHDRFFLDRMAGAILSLEEDGKIQHHIGNFTDYETYKTALPVPIPVDNAPHVPQRPEQLAVKPQRSLKFSFNEQREYEQIDERIAETEQQLKRIGDEILETGSDYRKLQELTGKQEQVKIELEYLLERWTYLTELAETIEAQRLNK